MGDAGGWVVRKVAWNVVRTLFSLCCGSRSHGTFYRCECLRQFQLTKQQNIHKTNIVPVSENCWKKVDAWHQLRTFSPTCRPRTALKPGFSSSSTKTGSKKQGGGLFGAAGDSKSRARMQKGLSHPEFFWLPSERTFKKGGHGQSCMGLLF